jgi:hypothetical protein
MLSTKTATSAFLGALQGYQIKPIFQAQTELTNTR